MQYQKIISKIINIAEKDIDIESFIKLSFAELLLFSDNFIEIDTSFELVFNNANLKVVDNTRNFPKKCKIDKSGQCFCANATKLTQITECKKDKSNLTGSHYCIPIFNEQKTQAILVLHAINQLDNIKSEFIKTIKNLLETFIRTKNREKKLISKAQQQNFLNQKLFSQSLEIDQKNLEIEEQKLQIEEQNEELRQNNEELQSLIENIEKQKEIIKESEEKYIFIAKNVSDVIWIWNLNKNKFTYISPAVYSLRGYTVEEAIRTHLLDSFTQSSAEYIAMQSQIRLEIFIKNHKEKIFYTDELQQYCKNGDIIWTEASTQFAFNKKNEIEVFGISRNINNRKKAELELKTAHKSITDSINYAKRIQTAILPSKNLLLKKLSKHFVLFKPRDVVSGDFYWWTNIKHYTIITVADCTGHGVPGAFMSMLGISILRDIINKQNFTNTSVILQKLRTEIIKTLQSGTQDGMDMAIISINQKTNTLQFSGANNPLFLIRKEKLETKTYNNVRIFNTENKSNDLTLYEFKADKMPVATHIKMDRYMTTELKLQTGDCLYMFSDGYVDQFGGEKNRKFMSKNFKKLLLNNAHKSMSEQKEILNKTLNDWKGKIEQVDDILVFGMKFNE